jgi:hypothetical protein
MQWILISSVLNWQPVYADQETCHLAAAELAKVYYQEVAACIPKPNAADESAVRMDSMFNQFLGMVKEMQKLEQKELDNTNK